MKSLILIIQFLTKLPLPITIKASDNDFTKGIKWFPFVGLIIGGLMYVVYMLASLVTSHFVAVTLAVIFQVFITGGLHLDGLADTFDGLYSYRDKERMLEIMKDSRVGTNGVLVLILDIVLKMVLLMALTSDQMIVLLIMPVVSRYMAVVLARFSKYARNNGMGGFFIGKTTNSQLLIASITVLLTLFYGFLMFYILPIMILLTFVYRYHVYQKIDGITGDVLGAWIELSEIMLLLLLTVFI